MYLCNSKNTPCSSQHHKLKKFAKGSVTSRQVPFIMKYMGRDAYDLLPAIDGSKAKVPNSKENKEIPHTNHIVYQDFWAQILVYNMI